MFPVTQRTRLVRAIAGLAILSVNFNVLVHAGKSGVGGAKGGTVTGYPAGTASGSAYPSIPALGTTSKPAGSSAYPTIPALGTSTAGSSAAAGTAARPAGVPGGTGYAPSTGYSSGSSGYSMAPATYRPGYGYSRPGFSTGSLLLPLAAGALVGTAAYSLLANDVNAYCDGMRVQCYKAPCQLALNQCPLAANTTLSLVACPEPGFSECYQNANQTFVCLGVRRPSYNGNDLKAYCSSPDGTVTASGRNAAVGFGAGAALRRVMLAAAAVAALLLAAV